MTPADDRIKIRKGRYICMRDLYSTVKSENNQRDRCPIPLCATGPTSRDQGPERCDPCVRLSEIGLQKVPSNPAKHKQFPTEFKRIMVGLVETKMTEMQAEFVGLESRVAHAYVLTALKTKFPMGNNFSVYARGMLSDLVEHLLVARFNVPLEAGPPPPTEPEEPTLEEHTAHTHEPTATDGLENAIMVMPPGPARDLSMQRYMELRLVELQLLKQQNDTREAERQREFEAEQTERKLKHEADEAERRRQHEATETQRRFEEADRQRRHEREMLLLRTTKDAEPAPKRPRTAPPMDDTTLAEIARASPSRRPRPSDDHTTTPGPLSPEPSGTPGPRPSAPRCGDSRVRAGRDWCLTSATRCTSSPWRARPSTDPTPPWNSTPWGPRRT